MSAEIPKPCPFCACPLAGVSQPALSTVRLSVKCPACHSHGGYGNTAAEAIDAWNQRTPTSPDPTKALCEADAWRDVKAERQRQIDAEGYVPEHDDEHDKDLALPRAAACYALAGTGGNGPFWITHLQVPQQVWPYRWEWKPKDRRSNLVRAAALLLAEIERVDRAALASAQPKGDGE